MADAFLIWGGDLQVSATGDIAISTGTNLGQQRVLRRLLTNLLDYIWQPDYGAGLGSFVGKPANQRTIEATIRNQLSLEPSLSQLPPPTVAVLVEPNGQVFTEIGYVDSNTGTLQLLSFSLGT
jgi:hypothetical protein